MQPGEEKEKPLSIAGRGCCAFVTEPPSPTSCEVLEVYQMLAARQLCACRASILEINPE